MGTVIEPKTAVDLYNLGRECERQSFEVLRLHDRNDTILYFDRQSRQIVREVAPFRPRRYECNTLESFAQMAKDLPGQNKIVLVNVDGATLLLDENSRRDVVSYGLRRSKTWDRLSTLGSQPPMSQLEIRALLRTGLDAQYGPADPVSVVSKVKFSSSTDGEASADVGKYAVSRKTAAELTGATDLPDTVMITANIWDNLHTRTSRQSVECGFDADPVTQKFTITPKAGGVELAEIQAVEGLMDVLRELLKDQDGAAVASVYAAKSLF